MDRWTQRFPPYVLREYAVVADGERAAVVGPRGEFAWMCAPRWHDDAVFSSLIGGGGVYAVTPVEERFVWGGHYEEGTLIWRSRWVTGSAEIECREALARPASLSTAVLLREVVAVNGTARVQVVLAPAAKFGQQPFTDLGHEGDTWTGRAGALKVRCHGLPGARVEDAALVAELTLQEGERHSIVVEISGDRLPDSPPSPAEAWGRTERSWRESVPDLSGIRAPRDVRQAYAVLHGLTSTDGGMVAAATTSLPERADTGRNYDYRYAWIRDQAMVGQGVASVGPCALMEGALAFVGDRLRADGDHLRPAYTVDGATLPGEKRLDLPGYPGATDTIGNRASEQFQLDVFGEALHLFAAAGRHGALSAEDWQAVQAAVTAATDHWQQADAGIWELDERHWAHSRLIIASGLQAIVPLAPESEQRDWQQLAERIRADVDRDCLHPSGRWQRAPDLPGLDAALLIPVFRGTAVSPDDPIAQRTVTAVLADLGEDEYLYRFRHGDQPLEDAEGAFVLCGLHASLALDQIGERADAIRWFERNRAACGPSGLFTEEYDVEQRQLRGNLPQAFVHGVFIEAAQALSD